MGKIEQLVGLCRTTLQRMESNSDIASALLRADQVFVLYGCSSLNDLLRPLSLSDDSGLLRCVAERRDEVSARQVITRESAKISPSHQSPQQKALHQKAGSTMGHLAQRQTAPVPPASSYSSPRSQRVVQKLFDSIRDELELVHEQEGRSSQTLPFNGIQVAEEKNGLQSPKKMTGGSQRHGFSADIGHSSVSYPFPAIPLESEKTGWFDNHPRHKTAAAGLLSKDAEPILSENTLKNWAAPFQAKERLKEINMVQQDKQRGGAAVTSPPRSSSSAEDQSRQNTAAASKKISPLHADETGSRNTDTLITPESASPFFPQQETPSSQLEQLVRKWQSGSQTVGGKRDQIAQEPTNGISTGTFHQRTNLSTDGGEWKSLAAEQQSPVDNDDVFSETLERVLQREMRRHGIEEEP